MYLLRVGMPFYPLVRLVLPLFVFLVCLLLACLLPTSRGVFPHLGLCFGFIYRTQPMIATGDGPPQHTARTHLMPNSRGSSHLQELQTLETLVIFSLDTGVATHL